MSETIQKAIDWDSVSLLHGAHFRSETEYLEETARQRGREWPWGLVHLMPDSLQVAGSPEQDHEIALTNCSAVTTEGRLIQVGAERQSRLLHTIRWGLHRDDLLLVYVGIARRKQTAQTPPAVQDAGLIECDFLEYRQELTVSATPPPSADYDWLPIGQLRRDVQVYRINETYIPECVYLRSHFRFVDRARQIARKGYECVLALREHPAMKAGRGMAVGLMTALVPVQVLVDQGVHPRSYLDRIAVTLRTLQYLTDSLPASDRGSAEYAQFQMAMQGAMRLIENIEQRDVSPANWYVVLEAVYRALGTFLIFIPHFRADAAVAQNPIYPPPPPAAPQPRREEAVWPVAQQRERKNNSGGNNSGGFTPI